MESFWELSENIKQTTEGHGLSADQTHPWEIPSTVAKYLKTKSEISDSNLPYHNCTFALSQSFQSVNIDLFFFLPTASSPKL